MSGGDPGDYEHGVDPVVKHDGPKSLRLAASVPHPPGYGTLMRQEPALPHRGHRVRVSAFVRGADIGARGDMWARVQAADSPGDGPGLGSGACQLSETFAWKPCEIEFDVPQAGDRIEIGIGLAGTGTIWLDDLAVRDLGVVSKTSPPAGWILAGSNPGDYSAAVDAAVKHSGAGSGSLRSNAADETEYRFGTLMQQSAPGAYRGKRVRMSAFIKATDVTAWAGLWMRVDGPSRNGSSPPLAFDNMVDRPIKGTSDWTRYAIVLDVDAKATNLAYGVLLAGGGAVWLDDVSFEVVDARVPTTGTAAEEPRRSPINLGFEAGLDQGGNPRGWSMGGENASAFRLSLDTGAVYDGKMSGTVAAVSPAETSYGWVTQRLEADLFRGKRLRLSAFVKTDKVDFAGLWMRVDSSRQLLAVDDMRNRPIKGTTDWTPYEVVLDVRKDAADLSFGLLLSGKGRAWIDGVKLEPVPKSVPTTDAYGASASAASNLDFEK